MRFLRLSALISGIALGSSAHAAIVYYDVADITVPFSDTNFLGIDFNGDAASSAAIINISGTTTGYDLVIGNIDASNVLVSAPAGAVYTHTQSYASRLGPGVTIPSVNANSAVWEGGDNAMQAGSEGHWAGTSGTAFLGVTFNPNPADNGAPLSDYLHGWVRVEFNDATNTVTLLDFAYETTPDMGITTGVIPEPHGAALALIGAGAFFGRRQRAK